MMRRLFRSLAYNYRTGGIRHLTTKCAKFLKDQLWSSSIWLIYEIDTSVAQATGAPYLTDHRQLSFNDLSRLNYEKVRSFPEDILRRYARGDRCHGFLNDGVLVTIGWSGSQYLELNIDETIPCTSTLGLFDFATMPAFQGRGYYTDALRQLTAMAFEDGHKSVWIAVHPNNTPSRKGIERAGFSISKTIRKSRVLGFSTHRESSLRQ